MTENTESEEQRFEVTEDGLLVETDSADADFGEDLTFDG